MSSLPQPVDLGRVTGHVEPAPGVLLVERQVIPLVQTLVLLGLLEQLRKVDGLRGRLVLSPVPVRVEHAVRHRDDVLYAVLHDLRDVYRLLWRRRNALHLDVL